MKRALKTGVIIACSLPLLGASMIGLIKAGNPLIIFNPLVLLIAYIVAGPGSIVFAAIISTSLHLSEKQKQPARRVMLNSISISIICGILLPMTFSIWMEESRSSVGAIDAWNDMLIESIVSCTVIGYFATVKWIKGIPQPAL